MHWVRVAYPDVSWFQSGVDGMCARPGGYHHWEAAARTHALNVDPGRSYLGDTLRDLGRDLTMCARTFLAPCPGALIIRCEPTVVSTSSAAVLCNTEEPPGSPNALPSALPLLLTLPPRG